MTLPLGILEETVELAPYQNDGDTNRLTHIVSTMKSRDPNKPSMSAQDIVDLARLQGTEVVALCGYRWVPVHDPEKYPLCKTCHHLAQQIMRVLG